jgi:hypothetical protein
MYVWRFPLFAAAALLTTTVTLFAILALLRWRLACTGRLSRGVVSGLAVASLLASPIFCISITEAGLASARRSGLFIDPPLLLVFYPFAFALVVLAATHLLFPIRATPFDALRWRVAFVAFVLVFAAFNFANWCSPGWCERFGFPFPYSWWSDAIFVINGVNVGAGHSTFAVLANVVVLIFVSVAFSVSYKHRFPRAEASPL